MTPQPDVDYTVVLVFPGFGSERENAEGIIESAIDWLNNNKDEPGFRFAYPVSAHLEIVQNAEEARERIEEDARVAMVIMHDLNEEERDELVMHCKFHSIAACYTVDECRRTVRRNEPFKFVLRRKSADSPSAHTLTADTLTGPVEEEDEETGDRIGHVIAVLALGVMQHHWEMKPR